MGPGLLGHAQVSIRHRGLLEAVQSLNVLQRNELQQTSAQNCKSFEECRNSTDDCGEGIYFLCLALHYPRNSWWTLHIERQKVDLGFSCIVAFIVEDCLFFLVVVFLPPKKTLVVYWSWWFICSVWFMAFEWVYWCYTTSNINCSSEGSLQLFCKSLLHYRLTVGTSDLRHVFVT